MSVTHATLPSAAGSFVVVAARQHDGTDYHVLQHVGNRTHFVVVAGDEPLQYVIRTTPTQAAKLANNDDRHFEELVETINRPS